MRWIRSKRAGVGLVVAVAVLTIALGSWQGWLAQAADDTWIVNDDLLPAEGGCDTPDFETDNIDAVIDDIEVSDGDTLVICEGTYRGDVTVDKSLTIEGRQGADRADVVIEVAPGPSSTTDGLTVQANDVTIRHLKVDGPIASDEGIRVNGDDATITDVEVTEWFTGIHANWASGTAIEDSYIHANEVDGILLENTSGSRIVRNTLTSSVNNQIRIDTADLAVVEDNTMSGSAPHHYQVYVTGRSHVQVLRNTFVTQVYGTMSNGGIELNGLPAEALVVIGGSDASANTFDGDLESGTGIQHYIRLSCNSQDTVNATHNYWKGSPVISRGVAGVIFNDEDDTGVECPAPDDVNGAVVFHPVATEPAPTPSPSPTPTPTPSPTPSPSPTPVAETRDFDLPLGWNNFVWTGANATAADMALDCIDGNFAIAYALQAGGWLRYVPGDPAITTLTTVDKYDNLLVLVTASGVQCLGMPVDP